MIKILNVCTFNCKGNAKSLNGNNIKLVKNFKYPRSDIYAERYSLVALNKLSIIRKSNEKKMFQKKFLLN